MFPDTRPQPGGEYNLLVTFDSQGYQNKGTLFIVYIKGKDEMEIMNMGYFGHVV